jgi:hypothetical protein
LWKLHCSAWRAGEWPVVHTINAAPTTGGSGHPYSKKLRQSLTDAPLLTSKRLLLLPASRLDMHWF